MNNSQIAAYTNRFISSCIYGFIKGIKMSDLSNKNIQSNNNTNESRQAEFELNATTATTSTTAITLEEDEDDEEEFHVYLKFDEMQNNLIKQNSNIDIINFIDGKGMVCNIDGYKFTGTHDNSLGTQLFFRSPKNLTKSENDNGNNDNNNLEENLHPSLFGFHLHICISL